MKVFEFESFCVVKADSRLEAWEKLEKYLKENARKFCDEYVAGSVERNWDKETMEKRRHQMIEPD